MKCCVFLRWCGDCPTRGLMMWASSLATPYVMDPLLENNGSKGCTCFMNFGKAIEFRGTALVGYNCLYMLVLRPPVCLMSLRREMSFFFLSWLVESFGSTL